MQTAQEHSERPEAALRIIKADIFKDGRVVPIHEWNVGKVDAVLFQIRKALCLILLQFKHGLNVAHKS